MQNSLAKDSTAAGNSKGRTTPSKSRAKMASGQRAPKNPIKKLIGTAKKKLKSSTKSIPTSLAATTKCNSPSAGQKKFLRAGNKRNRKSPQYSPAALKLQN